MKKIILIAITSILAFGCTKHTGIQPQNVPQTADTVNSKSPMRIGGDDDDTPIVMEIIRNGGGHPVEGATVMLVNGTDTVIRHTSIFGECLIKLPKRGTWDLTITHAGYESMYATINLRLPYSIRIDRLTKD